MSWPPLKTKNILHLIKQLYSFYSIVINLNIVIFKNVYTTIVNLTSDRVVILWVKIYLIEIKTVLNDQKIVLSHLKCYPIKENLFFYGL